MPEYYDGTKLLSLSDINGDKPEIYMCTANNTAGKTTYFSRLLVNKFLQKGDKFMLINRFTYELDSCAEKFYKDIHTLFFPDHVMDSKSRAKGIYHELYLDGMPCGYSVAMNSIDRLKKYSHLFSDTKRMFMDEFQSETSHYCQNEVNKFRALHKIVARGQGEMVRYVPVYMCANPITILNPYYAAMNIAERLNTNTKFLRGEGFVLEQGYVEAAGRAQATSGFNKAFGNDAYSKFTNEAVYLFDNYAFIDKPSGYSSYIATIKYNGTEFGIREYLDAGIIYCDNKADGTYPLKITVTKDDHDINYVMLRKNDMFLSQMRYFFQKGCFRFKNLACKEAILKALSY